MKRSSSASDNQTPRPASHYVSMTTRRDEEGATAVSYSNSYMVTDRNWVAWKWRSKTTAIFSVARNGDPTLVFPGKGLDLDLNT